MGWAVCALRSIKRESDFFCVASDGKENSHKCEGTHGTKCLNACWKMEKSPERLRNAK